MSGFPTGTRPGRPARVSWHGGLHFLSGAVAFLALIAACFLFARRFAAQGQTLWSRYTLLTGIAFTAAFAGIATGSSSAAVVIGLGVAVVAAFTWLTVLCLMLHRTQRPGALTST
jgi:heme A synthase